jgi:hypothetical protein
VFSQPSLASAPCRSNDTAAFMRGSAQRWRDWPFLRRWQVRSNFFVISTRVPWFPRDSRLVKGLAKTAHLVERSMRARATNVSSSTDVDCMYACMHVCMYACIYVCMYICACARVCTHTYTYTYNFFLLLYAFWMCVCVCVCVCVCMRVRLFFFFLYVYVSMYNARARVRVRVYII